MRILFSSDMHGDMDAYAAFTRLLGDYDCGVLSGDLLDEFIPIKDAVSFGLIAADEPEELHGDDFDEVEAFETKYLDALRNPQSINRKALEHKKRLLSELLSEADRPIFFVTGNHDLGEWPNFGTMVNVEDRRVHVAGYNFIGVKGSFKGVHSTFRRPWKLSRMIDSTTILVSHAPPFGVLDRAEFPDTAHGRVRFESIGSKSLGRVVAHHPPKYCLFGHVHEGFGRMQNMINGSWYLSRRFVSINVETDEILFFPPADDDDGASTCLDRKTHNGT
jgi:Icc-related predicted phosphoesterase